MKKERNDFPVDDRVIIAPEGFIDKKYLPLLRNEDLCIIQVRSLSDGLVFQTIRNAPVDA